MKASTWGKTINVGLSASAIGLVTALTLPDGYETAKAILFGACVVVAVVLFTVTALIEDGYINVTD